MWRKLTTRFKLSVVLLCAFAIGALAYLLLPKPDLGLQGSFYQAYSTALYDSNGKLLRLTLADDDRYRLYTQLHEISDDLVQATILYEDQNFYKHSGVDYIALIRAFWQTYVLAERRIGASTITMQTARLRWKIPSNTLRGKVTQIFRALQIARHYSKDEVLEAYLNLAPYGGNIEGIGAASLIYFNKPASALSLPEALRLALVPQNPSKRNISKLSGQRKQAFEQAKARLATRWLEAFPDDAKRLEKINLTLKVNSTKDLPFYAPHFTQYLLASDSIVLGEKIRTTLDLDLQSAMHSVVTRYVKRHRSKGIENASAMIIDTRNMHIKAMLGSADFFNTAIQGQVNGTQALRSPGSTLKPFVYALALDAGIIHPSTILKDLPTRYAAFAPENFGKGFVGPISATQALVSSRNVPAVQLQAELNALQNEQPKLLTLYKLLEEVGVEGLKNEDFYGLALSLGGGEITMQKLLELYAMIANKGVYKSAVSTYWVSANEIEESKKTGGITSLRASSKTNTKENKIEDQSKQLISREAAYLIRKMLEQNKGPRIQPRQQNHQLNTPVAWKTGTSWAYRDAWAVGLVGDYAIAVWIGNFTGQGNKAFIGRSAAGPLFFDIADYLSYRTEKQNIAFEKMPSEPLNISTVSICKATGDLYEQGCPEKVEGEFIPGLSPIKASNIYRELYIDKETGLQRCDRDLSKSTLKYYAFWPSDVLALYQQAGIFIAQAPAMMTGCGSLDATTQQGEIEVFSPQHKMRYIINSLTEDSVEIPLKASTDSAATKLFWFANKAFIGEVSLSDELQSSALQQTLSFSATTGTHTLLVVDDLGNSRQMNISVSGLQ
ncbi:penicillin-binding protein 1C [Glaciecola sp. MH2013]|uniref:penicillin-binding protein 1C n=1 Tax=Glaciecola sp. MH2013 TaxID=2785524 RepID=UPI00189E55F5|nr:penicillin-binding protein 1C [Glaciecola sp. MH2013]MBF7073499.1 penicillin-binding protein 1C [Glaciecola sp. MH2013]